MTEATRYWAFLSYSHEDADWADWIFDGLGGFHVPRKLRRPGMGSHLRPIFRDREELAASADLNGRIREAMESSDALVVLCSPNAARSQWVNAEIKLFKSMDRTERIFPLIVAGEPNAYYVTGSSESECFPPALRYTITRKGEMTTQPERPFVAADARSDKDGKENALIKIVAGLLGVGFGDPSPLQERTRRPVRLSRRAAVIGRRPRPRNARRRCCRSHAYGVPGRASRRRCWRACLLGQRAYRDSAAACARTG